MPAKIEHQVVDPDHPWLGLSPFTESTAKYFFGRDQEVREVFLRIREQPLTILFGRSGLGKTSLLGAGVIPKLKTEGFRPYLLRLGYAPSDAPLIEQLLEAVKETLRNTDGSALARDCDAPQKTIWEIFHHLPSRPKHLAQSPPVSPPVLIFDQFEEIFTLEQRGERQAQAGELITQLADLIENRPPVDVQDRLRADRRLARDYDFGSSPVRVVLTLRGDFLSNLESWKKLVPSVMRNRMELQPLNGRQALAAVALPGRLGTQELVSDEVAARIVCSVANRSPETPLEEISEVPPLLSVFCEVLNNERLKAKQPCISMDLCDTHISNVIPAFYQAVYVGLRQAQEVRETIEDRLVTEKGFRLAIPWTDVLSMLEEVRVADADQALEALTTRRLLSVEERNGARRVELTHDLLVPEIVKSRDRRRRQGNVAASIERLAPAVANFQIPPFKLVHHLRSALLLRDAGVPEAVIYYCSMILETMSDHALQIAGLGPGQSAFRNLQILEQRRLMRRDQASLAHGLRMLSNRIRHLTGETTRHDAALALFCVERWLEWFFCDYPFHDRLEHLTIDGAPLRLCPVTDVDDLLAIINDLFTGADCSAAKVLAVGERAYFEAPLIPALLADGMLQRGWTEDAMQLLVPALRLHPDDVRLAQLLSLAWSRMGEWNKALECLEPLYKRNRSDDETAGILAGVYKHMWQASRHSPKLLERAYGLYREAWGQEQSNAYLGINAAKTALWLGRAADARRLAEQVLGLLTSCAVILRRQAGHARITPNYWDQMTKAEALLLMGRLAEARSQFCATFADHESQAQSNEQFRKQAAESLTYLGIGDIDAWFDAGRRPASPSAVRVGVIGFPTLAVDDQLSQQIHAVLARLCHSGIPGRGPDLVVLSTLAEGADRLVAQIALGEPFRGHLDVILPLGISEYVQGFNNLESREHFQRLLQLTDVISFPPSQPEQLDKPRWARAAAQADPRTPAERRLEGYRWASREIADQADVLLAIWDGQPAQVSNDLAAIIDHARQSGRPVVLIDARPPYNVRYEGMIL